MLTLLMGTDWIANRDTVLQCLAADVKQEKPGRILIVPELISHETERRLCAAAGDSCSRFAEVLSFSRLAKRVSDYDNVPLKPCLDSGGRLVAMASAVKQLRSKLKAYASVETKPEFFGGLIDAMDEFKRCCITPADLKEASMRTEGSLAQKLEELALLLEGYDSVCAQGKCDPRDQMAWLLEELEESDYGSQHTFYIDGFPDFTRQHMNIIQHLACVSENVVVSLNCDRAGSGALAFQKAGQTAAELLEFARRENIAVSVQMVTPREHPLSAVHGLLLEGDLGHAHCENLQTIHLNSLRRECENALEQVVTLVTHGARFRDINIVCGNMSAYRNTLELMFEKCRIPVYVSGTEDILEQPAIATVFAALDAALGGFEQQDVLHYLKTMFSPLGVDTCDMVENYAIMWGIQGKKWTQPWLNHPYGLGQEWTDRSRERLAMLNDARDRAISPLLRLKKALDDAATLGDEVKALYAFLEEIHYSRKLAVCAQQLENVNGGPEAQILNQLWDILLTALEQLYDVLGDTVWEAENFTRLLKLLVSQYSVGTIPSVLDAVNIGPVNAMRCQQCKHLIVLGAEEGVMPSYAGTSGVLTDQERTALRRLGVPLTGGAMDGLLAEFADIYGVFCGADMSVTVSCSGDTPSFIYRRLKSLGGECTETENAGMALADPAEAAAFLYRNKITAPLERWNIQQAYSQIVSSSTHTLGDISPKNIQKLYGEKLTLSASQIDRLAQCRLAYFLQYGLFVKERTVAEVNPAEFGTYVHAVMEYTVSEVMELGGFRQVGVEEMVAIARKHSDNYAAERFTELDSQREQYLFLRNWDELEQIVRDLWDEMQHCQFVPVGFEVGFGENQDISEIDVSGKTMAASLRGFVDRVDLWNDGRNNYFRVVDYKTGKKDFDYCDIYNGYGLQMLLYLFALEDGGLTMLGDNSVPAGVQYFPARAPLESADGILTDEEARAVHKKNRKRKGLLLLDEAVLSAMEDTQKPERMPYSRKKDGTLSGNLADRKQFQLLKRYVFQKVGELVDEIASGAVAPNPYTRGIYSACSYCPYSAVCHKLTVEGRRNYQAITDGRFWEDVTREVKENG